MPYQIRVSEEVREQRRGLAPGPKRLVRRVLRKMEDDPFALDFRQLDRPEVVYRIREGDYRIVFEPGPGHRVVTVTRIGHREWVYEGLERSGDV